MPSMLEQAIIDAKTLKEAALKSAEANIIDTYSEQVKSSLNKLIEQEEVTDFLGLGEEGVDPEAVEEELEGDADIAEGVPDAFTEDLEQVEGSVSEGDSVPFEVTLDELQEALTEMTAEIAPETSEDPDADLIATTLLADAEEGEDEDGTIDIDVETLSEMIAEMIGDELEEDELDEAHCGDHEDDEVIEEKMTVDTGASLSGWAGRPAEDVKYQMELELARRRSTELEEELEALKIAQEELVFENKKLKNDLAGHVSVISSLQENVQGVNLSNARLLYTNRALRNTSLNERQKEKIADAISKAGSIEEAKTIHETLQSAVGSSVSGRPQSLSEAISRPSSVIRASRRHGAPKKADLMSTRMRKLAGIKE